MDGGGDGDEMERRSCRWRWRQTSDRDMYLSSDHLDCTWAAHVAVTDNDMLDSTCCDAVLVAGFFCLLSLVNFLFLNTTHHLIHHQLTTPGYQSSGNLLSSSDPHHPQPVSHDQIHEPTPKNPAGGYLHRGSTSARACANTAAHQHWRPSPDELCCSRSPCTADDAPLST
ncbi:hypothetical protein IWZ01DRAFT_248020 [Phyllosticta capitalensis]